MTAPSHFLYTHAAAPEIHRALAAVWSGKAVAFLMSHITALSACGWLYLCPARGYALPFLKRALAAFGPPRAEKSRSSPFSLPPSTLLALKESRNKIKVAVAALCLWYSYPMGKTWYIHLLSEPLLRNLSEWASYDNRYPSVQINAVFASDISCHTAQIVCADGQVRNTTFQRGENCCNIPLLSSSGTAY